MQSIESGKPFSAISRMKDMRLSDCVSVKRPCLRADSHLVRPPLRCWCRVLQSIPGNDLVKVESLGLHEFFASASAAAE